MLWYRSKYVLVMMNSPKYYANTLIRNVFDITDPTTLNRHLLNIVLSKNNKIMIIKKIGFNPTKLRKLSIVPV